MKATYIITASALTLGISACGQEASGNAEGALPATDASEVTLPVPDNPVEATDKFPLDPSTDVGLLPPQMYDIEECPFESSAYVPFGHPSASYIKENRVSSIDALRESVPFFAVVAIRDVGTPVLAVPNGLPEEFLEAVGGVSPREIALPLTPVNVEVQSANFDEQSLRLQEVGCFTERQTELLNEGSQALLMLEVVSATEGPYDALGSKFRIIDWMSVDDESGLLKARTSVGGAPPFASFLEGLSLDEVAPQLTESR